MKVLIADDDPISLRLLQRYLQRWGHEVVTARNGAEAWQQFQQGDFPIVISDWMMPEMDGLELIGRIHTDPRPGYVYTILVTARSQKEDLVEGMEAGADDFLTKPFDLDELRVRLREGERIIRLEQDLAEQNRALRDAQTALVQSEKLASLGQLAAGMAHEINNPIAYVANNLAVLRRDVIEAMEILNLYRRGWSSLAQVEPDLAAEVARREEQSDLNYLQEHLARLFDTSLDGLKRVRDVIRNLRDFARLDEAESKDMDINAGLQSTLEMLQHEIKTQGLRVELDFQQLPPVACQPGKINQVFLNLLLNAIEASPPEGVIQVRTRVQDQQAEIEIQDQGYGIRPEDVPRIFEPFFTTKPVGKGMGLGLSISYGIIRDHDGTIEVDSEPDRGSLFRVRLPVARAHSTAEQTGSDRQ